MKRLLSLIIALAAVLSIISAVPVHAADETSWKCGKNLTWEFDEESGALTISGTGKMYDYKTDVSIPVDKNVAPWKPFYQKIRSVVINPGATYIGTHAFSCCSVYEVSIPSSVIGIGAYAFKDCSKIEEIVLPEGLTEISECIFSGCKSLKRVSIPSGVTSIGDGAFKSCESLTSVDIPECVTSIGNEAFRMCSSLKKLMIPNNIEVIGDNSFENCKSLQFNVYENAKYLGSESHPYLVLVSAADKERNRYIVNRETRFILDHAFKDCRSMIYIVLPESLEYISVQAFAECVSLRTIVIPRSLTKIPEGLFQQSNYITDILYTGSEEEWSNVEIGNSNGSFADATVYFNSESFYDEISGSCGDDVTWAFNPFTGYLTVTGSGDMYDYFIDGTGRSTAPWSAFRQCILTVRVLQDVTSVGDAAFTECESLNNLTLGRSVTRIGDAALAGCGALHILSFPTSVKTVGNSAFYGCVKIFTSLPDRVENIGAYAFYGCRDMKIHTVPNTLKHLGDGAFTGCKIICTSYDSGVYLKSESNPYFIFLCPTQEGITSFSIHSETEFIYSGAFAGYTSLSSVTFPSSLLSVGGNSFYGCSSLKKATIPANVNYIGAGAFGGCTSMTSLTVNAGNAAFHSSGNCIIHNETGILVAGINNSIVPVDGSVFMIGEGAFAGCDGITVFSVPDGVIMIGQGAFEGCTALEEIYIPESLKLIDTGAFSGCTSLKTVYYLGRPMSIESLLLSAGNDSLLSAELIFLNFDAGDINLDDSIDMKDVMTIRRIIAGIDEEQPDDVRYGDTNGDGSLDMKDVLKLRRIVAGLD